MKQENGRPVPMLTGRCLVKCPSLCLQVCPFGDHEDSFESITREIFSEEDGIRNHDLLGWSAGSFVGYSSVNNHRAQGASGGMVTWMLEELLQRGEIDGAVCVKAGTEDSPLFEMALLNSAEQIRTAASTRYYPVHIADILRVIMRDGAHARYAVVGVSCLIHALRRLMLKNSAIRTRIRYLFGLVCEQCPSAYYTEALIKWCGGKPTEIKTVDYRIKNRVPAWLFEFRAEKKSGDFLPSLGMDESGPCLWHTGYFVPSACNFCDDIFAEAADAVFMDAWLPEYLSDPRGTSIVTVRRAFLRTLLEEGCARGTCVLAPIKPERVIESQSGNVQRKRRDIRIQIAEAGKADRWLPQFRQTSERPADKESASRIRRFSRTGKASLKLWPVFRRLPLFFMPIFVFTVDIYAGGAVYGARRAVRLARFLTGQKRFVKKAGSNGKEREA